MVDSPPTVGGVPGSAVSQWLSRRPQFSQVTFLGRSWRDDVATAGAMFDAFAVVRPLHELLWYLTQARALPAAIGVHPELDDAIARLETLVAADAALLAGLDVDGERATVNPLLLRASASARAAAPGPRLDHRGADLAGAGLRGANLQGASLRGADLRAADLSSTLFLTQSQLTAAVGDAVTRLPASLSRPLHWD